ncbi:SRPBCC domain-containing protein [Haladaptatus salinisoli]|uniref:SRPBCC domain-containing protein n=1 Tax=Haladaptatus salinisoli TaxID=2884876 RepID=UPI001D0A4D81|nr:SRPBCC domain-containing protein [Haladaptatus salinisoli]
MREILVETEVDAPPRTVWEVLADLRAYREWNPHVTDARGDLREGATVEIRVRSGLSRSRTIPVTVTEVTPERRLEWVGRVLSSRLFEGQHAFELEPLGEDRTRFVNRERLSGLLVPVVVPDDARRGYEAMNRALSERAERRFEAEADSEP